MSARSGESSKLFVSYAAFRANHDNNALGFSLWGNYFT
jgi:hypothetical protein